MDFNKDVKNEEFKRSDNTKDHSLSKGSKQKISSASRRRRNAINKFLNSYLKFFILILVLVLLGFAFKLILMPKFNKTSDAFSEFLRERKTEFLTKHLELEKYKKNVVEFSQIENEDIHKIDKIVSPYYSRDDLFTEIAYFLIKNNFKIQSINILSSDTVIGAGTESSPSRRPQGPGMEPQGQAPDYLSWINSLPRDLSYYYLEISLADIDYPGLKYLLDIIENNLKIIDIFSLNFNPSKNTLDLEAFVYYLK